MTEKIVLTGLVLSALWFVPGLLGDEIDPPMWVKALVIIPAFVGTLCAFFGTLVLIWAR